MNWTRRWRGRGVDYYGAFASRVASTASSRRESRIDGAEVLLAQDAYNKAAATGAVAAEA